MLHKDTLCTFSELTKCRAQGVATDFSGTSVHTLYIVTWFVLRTCGTSVVLEEIKCSAYIGIHTKIVYDTFLTFPA